jgi:hypothetical protein
VSPLRARARADTAHSGELLRLDIHPTDLERRRNVAALENLLWRARHRTPVTYDAL